MENQVNEKKKESGTGIRFFLILLGSVLLAAALLCLWAFAAFQMRYATDFIRAGMVGIYMLPCFLGGRFLRLLRQKHTPVLGALLGLCFYSVLLLTSFLVKGNPFSLEELEWETPLLCVLTGMAGALRLKNGKNSGK